MLGQKFYETHIVRIGEKCNHSEAGTCKYETVVEISLVLETSDFKTNQKLFPIIQWQ